MPKPKPFEKVIVDKIAEIDSTMLETSVAAFINLVKLAKECELRFNHDAIASAFEEKTAEFLELGKWNFIGLPPLLAHIIAEKAKWTVKVTMLGEESTDAASCFHGYSREAEMHEEFTGRAAD
ncbi:MAG TPA: hypothetical protein VMV71_03840 [Candidatus Paceibacterota bacterium]|nr:hypothetical protein [Candidatus Paceibacterota bacterium]